MRPEVSDMRTFQLRSEPPAQAGVSAVKGWFQRSRHGLKWFGAVLFFQIVSVWTNILGLFLVLPPIAAIILGTGIQVAALYVGLAMVGADEDGKARWKRALIPLVATSAFFSYLGFTDGYLKDQEARRAPMIARDDLKQQAAFLAGSIDEARRTAGSIYRNRIEYGRSLQQRVRSREARGEYAYPGEGEAMIAQTASEIESAQEALSQWNAFTFAPAEATGKEKTADGFGVLQAAHTKLGSLVSMLRKEEASQVTMPPTPSPSAQSKDSVSAKSPVDLALNELWGPAGWGWLALALMIELVPLILAHNTDGLHASDAPAATHPLGVQSLGPEDREIASRVTDFNAKLRPVHFVGANSQMDMERMGGQVDPVVAEYRQAELERLRTETLRARKDLLLERAKLEFETMRQMGAPQEMIQKRVEERMHAILAEFDHAAIRTEEQRVAVPELSPEGA